MIPEIITEYLKLHPDGRDWAGNKVDALSQALLTKKDQSAWYAKIRNHLL